MTTLKKQIRVLVVSGNDKIFDYFKGLLPPGEFNPIIRAGSAGEAKRIVSSSEADIIIINTPLPDEFGCDLAVDLSEGAAAVMLLVKNDNFEQTAYKVEDSGVLTLGKPSTAQSVYSAVRLLTAAHLRLEKLEKKNRTLQEKMADIRVVNRAKWLLISNLNMTEEEAHYFIEKQAMDTRRSRRETAEGIIRTYDK